MSTLSFSWCLCCQHANLNTSAKGWVQLFFFFVKFDFFVGAHLMLLTCFAKYNQQRKTLLFSYCFSLKWIAAAFVKKRQNKVASVLNASFNTDLFKEASISLIKYAPKTFSKNLLSDKVHII